MALSGPTRWAAVVSAFDPMRTSAQRSRLWGPHETRIDESPVEGQDLAARLATEIPTLTRHHEPLALLLRRRERKPGGLQHYGPDIGDIERVVGWQWRHWKVMPFHRIECDEGTW